MWRRIAFLAVISATLATAIEYSFEMSQTAEVTVDLTMSSPGSDWAVPGREAALVDVALDGKPNQHVMLYAGEARHVYPIFLGTLSQGTHRLTIERNARYSAAKSKFEFGAAMVREVPRSDSEWAPLAHAPILYARADSIGQFTDVPMTAYCERLRDENGPILQYTVIFSNEDGGTSTRGLMARWGRTTDIEYIYRAHMTPDGKVAHATIQAKGHNDVEFDGEREGTHPILIPSTRNNMVSPEGRSPIRYQIAPVVVDLTGHSREEVMDERPFAYDIMRRELLREKKLRPYGKEQGENISDPQNYAYFEIQVQLEHAALVTMVRLKDSQEWYTSNLGQLKFAREIPGWFRTTVELPPGTKPEQIAEVGFRCLPRSNATGSCRVGRVSKAFFLGGEMRPEGPFFRWSTPVTLATGEKQSLVVHGKPGGIF